MRGTSATQFSSPQPDFHCTLPILDLAFPAKVLEIMNEMLWSSWRHHGNPALSGNVATALELKVTLLPISLAQSFSTTLLGTHRKLKTSYRASCSEDGSRRGGKQLGSDERVLAPVLRLRAPRADGVSWRFEGEVCHHVPAGPEKHSVLIFPTPSETEAKWLVAAVRPRAEGSLPGWDLSFSIYQPVTFRRVSQLL